MTADKALHEIRKLTKLELIYCENETIFSLVEKRQGILVCHERGFMLLTLRKYHEFVLSWALSAIKEFMNGNTSRFREIKISSAQNI